MGHGAPRELAQAEGPLQDLPEGLSAKLGAALAKMDAHDSEFQTSRDDERHQQVSKAWTARCVDIVEDLRKITKVIVNEHQVLCDCGQEGAGVGIRPYVEDTGYRFDKLEVKLDEATVKAISAGTVIAQAPDMDAADYGWLEAAVVQWLVWSVDRKVG